MFLTLMVIGLVGLLVMAIPAFAGHGHVHPGSHDLGHGTHSHPGAHSHGHSGHSGHSSHSGHDSSKALARDAAGAATSQSLVPADTGRSDMLRFLPSPRAIFSVLALYGAFANALLHALSLPPLLAGAFAVVPALLLEHFLVRRVFNLIFRFQGEESSPLTALVLGEARALTPFRNGRGIVGTVRDGRMVQLSAELRADQANLPVKVGDRLRIEDVDARRERVTVSFWD